MVSLYFYFVCCTKRKENRRREERKLNETKLNEPLVAFEGYARPSCRFYSAIDSGWWGLSARGARMRRASICARLQRPHPTRGRTARRVPQSRPAPISAARTRRHHHRLPETRHAAPSRCNHLPDPRADRGNPLPSSSRTSTFDDILGSRFIHL